MGVVTPAFLEILKQLHPAFFPGITTSERIKSKRSAAHQFPPRARHYPQKPWLRAPPGGKHAPKKPAYSGRRQLTASGLCVANWSLCGGANQFAVAAALRLPSPRLLPLLFGLSAVPPWRFWQFDAEGSAVTLFAGNGNRAVMIAHHGLHDRQPQFRCPTASSCSKA